MKRFASVLVGIVVAMSLASGIAISPAAANTSQGIRQNPWIIADLGGTLIDSTTDSYVANRSPVETSWVGGTSLDDVYQSSYNANANGRGMPTTLGRTTPTNIVPKVKPTGKLGLILNTGFAMLGLGGMLFTPDDILTLAPNAPSGPQVIGTDVGYSFQLPFLQPNPPATSGTYVNQRVLINWIDAPKAEELSGQALIEFQNYVTADSDSRNTSWNVGIAARCRNSQGQWSSGGTPVVGNTTTIRRAPGGSPGIYAQSLPISWSCPANTVPHFFLGPTSNTLETALPAQGVYPARYFLPDSQSGQYETTDVTTRVECTDAAGVTEVITTTVPVLIAPGVNFNPPSLGCPSGEVATKGSVTGKGQRSGTEYEIVPQLEADPRVRLIPQGEPCLVQGTCTPRLETESDEGEYLDPVTGKRWADCAGTGWALCLNKQQNGTRNDTNTRCRSGNVVLDPKFCVNVKPSPTTPNQVDAKIPPPYPTANIPGNPTPIADNDCWPNGWGIFNPLEWILKPIKCALEYAFVPSDMTAWRTDAQAITSKPPVSFFITAREFWLELNTTTGCIQTESCPDRTFIVGDAMGIVELDPFAYVIEQADEEWMIRLRQLGIFATYAAVVWWTVNRISASFGGKVETE